MTVDGPSSVVQKADEGDSSRRQATLPPARSSNPPEGLRMSAAFNAAWQDIRFAGRRLRRSPAFFSAAVARLALGIGANAAMFSVLYGVLLKRLPFEQPERLVSVWSTAPGIGSNRMVLAAAQYFTSRRAAVRPGR